PCPPPSCFGQGFPAKLDTPSLGTDPLPVNQRVTKVDGCTLVESGRNQLKNGLSAERIQADGHKNNYLRPPGKSCFHPDQRPWIAGQEIEGQFTTFQAVVITSQTVQDCECICPRNSSGLTQPIDDPLAAEQAEQASFRRGGLGPFHAPEEMEAR